jgi:uncharacterized protein (DUF2249 family)
MLRIIPETIVARARGCLRADAWQRSTARRIGTARTLLLATNPTIHVRALPANIKDTAKDEPDNPVSPSTLPPETLMHACDQPTIEAIYPFDARGIAKRFRHAAIFGALDALTPGETMRFCNDHDPLPLLAQLQSRYGDALAISYLQREHGAIVIDFTRRA